MRGASLIGIPLIGVGTNGHMAFGQTAPIEDTSDVWLEELNKDETQYFVDNEWKDIKEVPETIKVKGEADIEFKVRHTHRGPLMDFEILQQSSGLLFGGDIIDLPYDAKFSFAWGNMRSAKEHSFTILRKVTEFKKVKSLWDFMEELTKDGYYGFSANFVMADSEDIAYQLALGFPKRKNLTPFLGCRVLDGRTTEFDWDEGVLPLTSLPRSFNPEKGYIVTANNRHTSENAKYDWGSTIMSTGRSIRIDEMI